MSQFQSNFNTTTRGRQHHTSFLILQREGNHGIDQLTSKEQDVSLLEKIITLERHETI